MTGSVQNMSELFINMTGIDDCDDESNDMSYMTVLTVSCFNFLEFSFKKNYFSFRYPHTTLNKRISVFPRLDFVRGACATPPGF